MDYTWENLNSREFEIVACNYAYEMFPEYLWKLTQSTKDNNHDFYSEFYEKENWGEAKHSKTSKKIISRNQWDPTLVSAKLINSVNQILLITCANIPLSYILRGSHMVEPPLEKIYYINRLVCKRA